MKLLHIIASPRGNDSNTLCIANAFLDALRAEDASLEVDAFDRFNKDLPAVAGDNIEAKYNLVDGQPINKEHKESRSWKQIEALIANFLSANAYVISAPMWNFSLPYALK